MTTRFPSRSPLFGAMALALALAWPMATNPAQAQDSAQAAPAPVPEENTSDRDREYKDKAREKNRGRMTMREKREARLEQLRESKDGDKDEDDSAGESEASYPLATREAPDLRPSRDGAKILKEMQDAFNAGDYAKAMALADKAAGREDANAYEKSFAYVLAGNAASSSGDDAAAADYFRKAIAANGLDNNNHYNAMFNLAVVEYGLDQSTEALATLDRFLAETKADKIEAQNLRGALLINLERYDEAARLYEEQLALHPDDKTLLLNAVAAYQSAGADDKATALLAKAATTGSLSSPNEYRALYVSYINADRDAEAEKIINDGLEKGILQEGPQLAKDYMVLGQKAYYEDDTTRAIAMYERAASMADSGEAALNLAKIHFELGHDAEAKAAAQRALDQGVENPEEARKLLGGG